MYTVREHELGQSRDDSAVMKPLDNIAANTASGPFPSAELPCLDKSYNSSAIAIQESVTVQRCFVSDALPLQQVQSNQTYLSSTAPKPSPKFSKRSSSCESLRSGPSSTMRFFTRQNPNLQLPPFESLGIASSVKCSSNSSPLQTLQQPETMCEISSLAMRNTSSSCASSEMPPSHTYNSRSLSLPLTPPEEVGSIKWDPESNSPISDPHSVARRYSPSRLDNFTNGDSPPPGGDDCRAPESTSQRGSSNGTVQQISQNNFFTNDHPSSWLKSGIELVVSSLHISKTPGQAVQMVSQTLPCPPTDHSATSSPSSAFSSVVEEIQLRLQPDQSPYINIIHAVPPKFSLNNLPTSPPSTPNRLSPGDDYFNLTVFSSGAPVPAYACHDFGTDNAAPGSTHAPTPIVPPYSVHVSIVERYLPPPSPREYRDLFSATGPSVLVDRLRELSPQGGSLVLIYPTKQGARTFKNKYLGPILEPLLRQMVVVNELSADVSKALGCMPAVNEMHDFETMQNNILRLCHNLNARESALGQQSAPRGSKFSIMYGAKGEVRMDRKSWIEWYIQQETPRARDILNGYWRNSYRPAGRVVSPGGHNPTNRETPCPSLLQVLFQGIRDRSNFDGTGLGESLEVGVFVIRRSGK
ncbi:hypothetical protein AJ79_06968 [Helicocarpus griseus UAMH5409]|uniref:Uncharacterized protein n=1 Tax=Helicocarpus griseus UAMH5409 TaxID=1447875 RepID=A0A2B7X7X7_9EURO|nr:hypothetical protein AJ79_06968 [Helicocarpus griseus UAMH5409]